jgi:hypothetical protein
MSRKSRSIIVSGIMIASFGIGTQLEVSRALGSYTYCTQDRCTVDRVPYLYQYDNPYGEGNAHGANTCQVTSLAMVLNYVYERDGIPKRAKPEQFYSDREYAKTPEGVAQILKEQLGHGLWSRTGTRDEIKGLIRSQRPVVVNGYFTKGGHVLVITGFTNQGWIVNDPAGLWSGDNENAYPNSDGSGFMAVYSYSSLSDEVIGADGDIWYASGDSKPINTGYGSVL